MAGGVAGLLNAGAKHIHNIALALELGLQVNQVQHIAQNLGVLGAGLLGKYGRQHLEAIADIRQFAAVDVQCGRGIGGKQRTDTGFHGRFVAVASVGNFPHQCGGLEDAGQGQGLVVQGAAHASTSVLRRVGKGSPSRQVSSITPPPRQPSPSYNTTDWPKVTARWASSKTSLTPPSITVTSQSWSGWR